MRFSKRVHTGILILLALAWLTSGCDSANPELPRTTEPHSATTLTLGGELFLGRFVSGGVASLETLGGQVLASSSISPTGSFLFRLSTDAIPTDFRVRATPAGTDIPFFLEVRGYAKRPRFLRVNVVTTLASLHAQGRPDLTLEQASQEVANILGIPSQTNFASLSESRRSPFSHLAFFVDASAAGGWKAFSAAILAETANAHRPQAQGDPTARFAAAPEDLSAPLDGIEDGLRPHLLVLQTSNPVAKGVTEILGEIGGDLWDSAIVSTVTDVAWTNIAERFGLNFGTTQALEKIQEQLEVVLDEINAIDLLLDEQDYSEAANKLAPAVAYLEALSLADLSAAVNQGTSEGLPSNTPIIEQSPTSGIGALLGSVASLTTAVDLQQISDFQLNGANVPNMNFLWRRNKVDNVLGVDVQARFMDFPIRSNAWLDIALQNYEYYKGYQSLAGKWLADNARQGTNPASDITTANDDIDAICTSLKAQRGQFPAYLASDEVIVDLQNGVMWHTKANAKMTQDEAKSYAASLSVEGEVLGQKVTYTDWRLPTYAELKSLQDRGRFFAGGYDQTVPSNSNTGYGDTGQALAGLPGLGFVGVSEAFSDPDDGVKTTDGGMWFGAFGYTITESYVIVVSTGWVETPYAELEFNRANKDPNYKSSTDRRPFLLCRSIGEPLLGASAPGLTGATIPADDPFPAQLAASLTDAEYPSLGVPTGIDNVVDISLSQTATDIIYSIYLGGDFGLGNVSANASRSNPSKTLTATLKPYSGKVNESPVYNALTLVPSYFTEKGSVFEVSNLPPAFDGTGGQAGFQAALNTFGSSGFIRKNTDDPGPQTAQLTSTVYGYDESTDAFPAVISKSGNIGQAGKYENGKTRQPAAFQISPRNRVYDSASSFTVDSRAVEQYSASLFFDNQTISSQTSAATWSLLTANGDPYTGDAVTLVGGLLQIDLKKVPRLGLSLQIQATMPARNGWPSQTDTVQLRAVQEI